MTSPIDYARLISAIDGKAMPPDLLSTNLVHAMLTPSNPSVSAGVPYGMGWQILQGGEIRHDGAFFECARTLAVRRPDGLVYLVFCNTFDLGLYDALKSTLDSGVAAIKSWPTNDLFPAALSYEAWRARHFSIAELSDPDVSGDGADPDGDGISNLIEYSQNLDPRSADHEPWLQARRIAEGDQARLAVEYRARPLGHAVHYQFDVSSDLKRWNSFQFERTEELEPDGMVRTTLTEAATTSGVDPGARFIRVTITSPM